MLAFKNLNDQSFCSLQDSGSLVKAHSGLEHHARMLLERYSNRASNEAFLLFQVKGVPSRRASSSSSLQLQSSLLAFLGISTSMKWILRYECMSPRQRLNHSCRRGRHVFPSTSWKSTPPPGQQSQPNWAGFWEGGMLLLRTQGCYPFCREYLHN